MPVQAQQKAEQDPIEPTKAPLAGAQCFQRVVVVHHRRDQHDRGDEEDPTVLGHPVHVSFAPEPVDGEEQMHAQEEVAHVDHRSQNAMQQPAREIKQTHEPTEDDQAGEERIFRRAGRAGSGGGFPAAAAAPLPVAAVLGEAAGARTAAGSRAAAAAAAGGVGMGRIIPFSDAARHCGCGGQTRRLRNAAWKGFGAGWRRTFHPPQAA